MAGPLAIGLALTLIHLISILVTNTSVNPARGTGPALVPALSGAGKALAELRLSWAAPIVGAVIAGVIHRMFETKASTSPVGGGARYPARLLGGIHGRQKLDGSLVSARLLAAVAVAVVACDPLSSLAGTWRF